MAKRIALVVICAVFLLIGCAPKPPLATEDEPAVVQGSADEGIGEIASDDLAVNGGEPTSATVSAAADEPVAAAQKDSFYWGYINTRGEWVIAPQYEKAYPFVDNAATVKTESGWQIINKNNDVIAKFDSAIEVIEPIAPERMFADSDSVGSGCTIFDGMIIIAKDGNGDSIITERGKDLYGYADMAGKIIVEPKYANAHAFGEGVGAVGVLNADGMNVAWGLIDKTGSMVVEPQFAFLAVCSQGFIAAQYNAERLGFIDKTGQWAFDETIYPNGSFSDGYAPVTVGHAFGVLDLSGNVTIVPGSENPHMGSDYSPIAAYSFKDGLYSLFDVSQPNTPDGWFPHGFIDATGNFAIPAQTEWKVAQNFSDGMCCVFIGKYNSMDNKYGYIDKTGKVVIPIQYTRATMFHHGYALAATGDPFTPHYSIIDKTGKTVAELAGVTQAKPFTT